MPGGSPSAEATSAGIYGTVAATALIAGLSDGHVATPSKAFELLVAGQFALFLGHAYAEYLGAKAAHEEGGSLGAAAVEAWPLFRACGPAAAAIVLWWTDVLSGAAAYWLALGLGVGQLLLLGYRAGSRAERGRVYAARAAAVDGLLGLIIVGVKVLAK